MFSLSAQQSYSSPAHSSGGHTAGVRYGQLAQSAAVLPPSLTQPSPILRQRHTAPTRPRDVLP